MTTKSKPMVPWAERENSPPRPIPIDELFNAWEEDKTIELTPSKRPPLRRPKSR